MSVHKKPNGKWCARYRDEQNINRQKSFELKKDAIAYERNQKRALERGEWVDPKGTRTKLSEVFEMYFQTKRELAPKSKNSIESIWRCHIEPRFGSSPLSSITMAATTKWMTDAVLGENANTTSGRITKAQELLSTLLDFSVDHGFIIKNPLRKSNGRIHKIALPKNDKSRIPMALTSEELVNLAGNCGDFEPLVLFAGVTGLRWAEIVGLRVGDINLSTARVVVDKSLSEVNGNFFEKSTKSGQTRSVVVPKYLHPHLVTQMQGKAESDYLFTNSIGNPLSLSNFTKRVFKPAIAAAGVPPVTPHDLRHTAASNAIALGANILSVANMLGHSDPTITLKRYGHLFSKDQDLLSDSLSNQYLSLVLEV
jgi:integrase